MVGKKITNLRIFDDENGVMNRSVIEAGGEIMVVSQFTLHASTKKGNRPSYLKASKPDIAIPMYKAFCEEVGLQLGKPVQTGTFGADMKIELLNDGPVTIIIDSQNKNKYGRYNFTTSPANGRRLDQDLWGPLFQ